MLCFVPTAAVRQSSALIRNLPVIVQVADWTPAAVGLRPIRSNLRQREISFVTCLSGVPDDVAEPL